MRLILDGELSFQPPGSHACIFFSLPPFISFYLLYLSIHLILFAFLWPCLFTFYSVIVYFYDGNSCSCWSLKIRHYLISNAPPIFSVWFLSFPSHGCFLLLSLSSSLLPPSLYHPLYFLITSLLILYLSSHPPSLLFLLPPSP